MLSLDSPMNTIIYFVQTSVYAYFVFKYINLSFVDILTMSSFSLKKKLNYK